MAGQVSKRKRQPYDVGESRMEPSVTIGRAGVWTKAENLMIVNGNPEETDSKVSAFEMNKRVPHHSFSAVAHRYFEMTIQNMGRKDITQLWHMWLL